MISILIAARNEAHNIINCLQSIENLTYPKDQLEVWIGDDESSDSTYGLVENFIAHKPYFNLLQITSDWGQARGKANVLAQLAAAARGDYFLITDADVAVPPHWVQTMMAALQPGVGIVTGVTVPKANTAWMALQALDWVHALSVINQLARWRIPVTTMGNNMLVTRAAYEATGGYENMPFSITEDYQLFRQVLTLKYGFRQIYSPDAVALTLPMPNLSAWLHQRKRWTYGALQSAWFIKLILFSPLIIAPLLIGLSIIQPWWTLLLGLGYILIQASVIARGIHRLRLGYLYPYLWLYPFYFHFSAFATVIYYYLPTKTVWKGRVYE